MTYFNFDTLTSFGCLYDSSPFSSGANLNYFISSSYKFSTLSSSATRATLTPTTKATTATTDMNSTMRTTHNTAGKAARRVDPSGATRKTKSYNLSLKSQFPEGSWYVLCHLGMLVYRKLKIQPNFNL